MKLITSFLLTETIMKDYMITMKFKLLDCNDKDHAVEVFSREYLNHNVFKYKIDKLEAEEI